MPFVAGIDHAFGFPSTYLQRYGLTGREEFLADFVAHWPTDQPNTWVDTIREAGPLRTGWPGEFRSSDRWINSVKFVFTFDVQGQVAKSTHAGLP